MNPYEQKQEDRKQRYLDRADDAAQASDAHYQQWKREAETIPLGQPILIGHHSERGHRAHLKRLDNKMRKSVEESDKAKHYRQKAASVGTGGISSDDPDAITKLQAELDQCEKVQARMKKANHLIRFFHGAKEEKERTGYCLAMQAEGFTEPQALKLLEPDFCGRIGFPDYALSNNSANMRRLTQRIASLTAAQSASDVEEEGPGYTYREDTTENRVMLEFPGKPAEEIRTLLKANGFRWSPQRGAWVRFLNGSGRAAAQYVRTTLDAMKGQP